MSNDHDEAPAPNPAQDIPPELSRELHPSMGLSSDAVKHLMRLAQREMIIRRSRRAIRGGPWTEFTRFVVDERRRQSSEDND